MHPLKTTLIGPVENLLDFNLTGKESSLCNKLRFSNPYIFRFQCRKPLIFKTMTSVRSNNISLKYQRFMTLGFKDIGIRRSEFVAKNQLLYLSLTRTKTKGIEL